ncbi:MAG: helix-turn-helix transcriptional regulator [Gammaproteobacteria bacterium]|nr:helix-turn-helix transcriptional regulator [Gammaproteobacteria bacterium]
MNRLSIKPDLIRWARERAGLQVEDLITKFKKLTEWESGETRPTFKQLEAFAHAVHVPFGYLFLTDPPEEYISISDFRTVADKANTRPSPDLLDTLCAMLRCQAWLREHLIEEDIEPLTFVDSALLSDEPDTVGHEMRRTLGLEEGWATEISTWQYAVDEIRRKIEELGVMAVINGVVGNNTQRRLSVTEFRGFALTDSYAPLIFEDPKAPPL